MNKLNTPEAIYTKIVNKDIKIEKGVISLISLLQKDDNEDLLHDSKEIIDKLALKFEEIYDILVNLLKIEQKPFTRLINVKLIIISFPDKCKKLIQEQIRRENSAIFLTLLYSFLKSQTTEISEILNKDLIEKYAKIYDLDVKECPFIIDLEKSQINKDKQLDIITGYFKKFETNGSNQLENSSLFNYVVKNHHVHALNLNRWEFKEIPESICLLSELRYLNLSNLKLTSLPQSIEILLNLEYLNLSGNEINKLPKWLIEFANTRISKKYLNEGVVSSDAVILALMEILLGKKLEKIEQINDAIHWETALNFKLNDKGNVLSIYIKNENLKIGIFPEYLCNLKYLEELELPDSSIQVLPECIGNLKTLKYLNLYNNRINIVPETIEKLINLEYLDLDDNEMSENSLLNLRWYKIGQKALEEGEFNNAIIECKITLEVYPKNKYAWYHLGIAYKELGNNNEAENAFKTFLDIDNTNSLVWSEISEVYHSNKEYTKAIEAIKRAIDIEPETAILYSNLAFNYKKLGYYSDAIKAYSQTLEINPNNVYVWRDLASIYRIKGDIIKAIDADEHALELELKSKIE